MNCRILRTIRKNLCEYRLVAHFDVNFLQYRKFQDDAPMEERIAVSIIGTDKNIIKAG
jgi:hypothetical protein